MQASDIPRNYNAAEDLVGRHLAAGRAGKTAYLDDAGQCSFGELAERVNRFGNHRDLHYSLHSFPTRRSSDLGMPVEPEEYSQKHGSSRVVGAGCRAGLLFSIRLLKGGTRTCFRKGSLPIKGSN